MVDAMLDSNFKQVDLRQLKFIIAEFGTVVRDGAGNVVGVFPTEMEAYEMISSLSEEVNKENV